jgi:hypothetical protein
MAESSAYRLDKDKEDAIHNWVKTALGFEGNKVIWDRSNIRRPERPYATLNISSGPRNVGRASEERYKELDTFQYAIRKVFTLTVGIYGGNGYLKKLEDVIDSLQKPTIQTILRQAGLANWGSEDPIDLSSLLDTKFEDRASVDFLLAYGKAIEDTPGEIQNVRMYGMRYRPFVPDINTIALYRLNGLSGSVIDDSDNKLNAINVGCDRGQPGQIHKSFYFGKDEYNYVDMLVSGFENAWEAGACNEGTIDFHFKSEDDIWDSTTRAHMLFSIASIVPFDHNIYIQGYIYNGNIYFDRRINAVNQFLIANISNLNLGTGWHFFRFTWTLDELNVYIDEKLIATEEATGIVWDIAETLTRAKIGSDGTALMIQTSIDGGWMEEFRISDKVRTEKDYYLIDKTVQTLS